MAGKEAPGKLANVKGTQKSARSTTKKAAKKAAPPPGPHAEKADGESAVLATIAAMPAPDRTIGERLTAVVAGSLVAGTDRSF